MTSTILITGGTGTLGRRPAGRVPDLVEEVRP